MGWNLLWLLYRHHEALPDAFGSSSRTVCPLTLRRLTVCKFFVIVLRIICSLICIQALFNKCTIFYRSLEAFYIALGHINPIGNY